eukprot:5000758-Pleurochrysis_carterae.AAC.2
MFSGNARAPSTPAGELRAGGVQVATIDVAIGGTDHNLSTDPSVAETVGARAATTYENRAGGGPPGAAEMGTPPPAAQLTGGCHRAAGEGGEREQWMRLDDL